MPDRIPLASGKETPAFMEGVLGQFGRNIHREPNFRVIWSSRPQNYLAGELVLTYEYLGEPRWILEAWLPPEKFAGHRASWGVLQEAMCGEYPTFGAYFICDPQLPLDWEPSEGNAVEMCALIVKSRDLAIKQRVSAILEGLQGKEDAVVETRAEMIDELFDSASLGKIQAAVSGPKNNFRTPEDWERDRDRSITQSKGFNLPTKGGAIYQPES